MEIGDFFDGGLEVGPIFPATVRATTHNWRLIECHTARIDLDTALGRPLWAETGPAHGRAVGVLTLPGGLLRALTACPVGKTGRPRAVKQSKQEGTRDMHYLCSFWLYFLV